MATEISDHSFETADRLHSAAIHLLRRLRREDEASGLNAPRLSALSVIVFGGPIALGDLAAAEQVRPPTMTRIVDGLAELGLVRRMKSREDGRSVQIAATAKGRKLLMAARVRRISKLASQIAALGAPDRRVLAEAAHTLSLVVARIV